MTMEGRPPWQLLGEEFVKQYYLIFDSNREQLAVMYAPDAMFTFEDHMAQGQAAIKEILTPLEWACLPSDRRQIQKQKLTFTSIQHVVTKIDCQPTSDNGVVLLVTGQLKADNDPPHAYSQMFYLKNVNGAYFIGHDIFRLSIHNG